MKGRAEEIMTDELQFLTNEDHAPVVLYITNENFEFQGDAVYAKVKQMTDIPFDFCELPVANWDDCLTPWATDPQMKGRSFTGGGKQLLEKIGENVLPLIDEKLPNHREIYIAGYSLAGLFSLWTLYECDRFDGAVCCSRYGPRVMPRIVYKKIKNIKIRTNMTA